MTLEVIQGDAEDGYVPFRMVYIGQRTDGGFAWRGVEDNRIRVWKGKDMRARLPGAIYTVESKIEGESMYVRPATLRYTGDMAEDAAVLQAREAKADQERRAKALERNTSKTAVIDEAIAGLLELAAPMSYYDRQALAELVRDRILKGK